VIRISSTSNGRTYESHSDETPKRKSIVKRQSAYFDFRESTTQFGKRRPAEVEVGVAYNAITGRDDLESGPKHVREAKFSAPLDMMLDICLTAIEQKFIELPQNEFNRMLKILADRAPQLVKTME
jgi:hypothetical protein